jgi:aspartyl protease family protein
MRVLRIVVCGLVAGAALAAGGAWALDIEVVGTIPPNRAMVMINGAGPRVISTDNPIGAVHLVSAGTDSAEFIIDGHRETIKLGGYRGSSSQSGRATTSLIADGRGHFTAQGTINGASITFLVDTGATLVTISAVDARRCGIDYSKGQMRVANTANGPVTFHQVTLDSVKVGDIVLNNVTAAVQESGLSTGALLGMSFLQRTEMTRDGANMVLTKRY